MSWKAPACPRTRQPARACLCSAGIAFCSHQDKLDLTRGRLLWLMIPPHIFSHSNLAWLYCCAMHACVCVCVQICLAVTVNTLFLREDKEFGSLCRGVCAYGTESHAEVAAPVVRLLFARQRFPSIVQAASPLYPEFVKESSKCHRFAFTPTGFLSCGSNQHWEVASMPRCPSQKLSTLLFFYYFLFFFFFPKCHLSCSSPIVFLRQTTIKAPMFFHY